MAGPSRLTVDRLEPGAVVEVRTLDGFRVGERPIREPHRHDYHELLWVRSGSGEHLIDGEPVAVDPPSITVIGRGQVHQFQHAENLRGGLLRFTDAVLAGGGDRVHADWLLAGRGGRTIAVPPGDAGATDAMFAALATESGRPPDPYAADVERHLVMTLLLWLERWYDARRIERRESDDAEVQLHRRFTRLLEADFAAHHHAAHYADALAVPAAALSRALVQVTGRGTKELITDRVMLEAARQLRYDDRPVSEIAFRVGFRDPLYFSRAFKRWAGRSPQAYRDDGRGA